MFKKIKWKICAWLLRNEPSEFADKMVFVSIEDTVSTLRELSSLAELTKAKLFFHIWSTKDEKWEGNPWEKMVADLKEKRRFRFLLEVPNA